ncbi:CaiB/BaiF CoA-transferase family protein [soil metagenome]
MSGVLDGIRIIEQGTFITGPAAGVLLADLGADVIKVEQPGTGDPFRASPDGTYYDPNFQAFNRNKRSIALDTRQPGDLQTFDALVRDADVFIQNFRPGIAERLGVGAQRLQQLNPRLVYCSISGFGSSGEAATRPCYDTIAQAASGYLNMMLNPENERVLGPAVADSLTGFYAAYGILGALHERHRTGRGRIVEVSMLAAMIHFNVDAFTHYFADGEQMGPYSRPAASQAHVLPCRDGKRIALHMSTPIKFWEALIAATGEPERFDDPRFHPRARRIANHALVIETLKPIFVKRDRAEWCQRLEEHDVPFAPVYSVPEVLSAPELAALDVRLDTRPGTREFSTVRNPVRFDGRPIDSLRAPPLLDEHRDEILADMARTT